MIRPHVELSDVKFERRSSGRYAISINIIVTVDTISDEIQVSPRVRIDISLASHPGNSGIRRLIQDQLINRGWLAPKISRAATKLGFTRSDLLRDQFVSQRWLSDFLASEISELGFGPNGLTVSFAAKISPSVLTRMVQLGKMSKDKEDLESSKMETEMCSICLDNIVSSRGSNSKHGEPTRMTCSHLFHDSCLLVWLQRRNNCPLCRTVLYDRPMTRKMGIDIRVY